MFNIGRDADRLYTFTNWGFLRWFVLRVCVCVLIISKLSLVYLSTNLFFSLQDNVDCIAYQV
jgi:hypothetical protein